MKEETKENIVILSGLAFAAFSVLLYVLFAVGIPLAVIYVLIHFVLKYW
jgi:hypothetical protein